MSRIRLATISALLIISAPAFAAGNISRATYSDSFEIGLEGEEYSYREPLFAKLQGPGIGLNGTYQFNLDNYFLRANIIADFISADYSSDGTGSVGGQENYLDDFRGMFGYNFKFSRTSTLSPYVGVGYRLLFDAGGGAVTSTGASAYDRRSEYLYIPLGASYDFDIGHWELQPTAEYDFFVQGWQTTYLSDLGFDNNLINHQSGGFGARADIMVTPPLNFYHFTFGPYFRYWNIHNSDVQPLYSGGIAVGAGQEPANNTTEVGLRTSIKFQ